MWARVSSFGGLPPVSVTGRTSTGVGGGGVRTGGALAAAPLPPRRTTLWQRGQRTLNGRSGTLASSMAIFCEHWGQRACTLYLSIRSSNSEPCPPPPLGLGLRIPCAGVPEGGPLLAGGLIADIFSVAPAPWVSSRNCRFVR